MHDISVAALQYCRMSTLDMDKESVETTVKRSLDDVLSTDTNDVSSSSPKRPNLNSDGKEVNDTVDNAAVYPKSISPDRTTSCMTEESTHDSSEGIIEGKDDDNEICMLSPSKVGCNNDDNDKNNNNVGDSPMVVKTNLTNAIVQYPHSRVDCGVYDFETTDRIKFCPKCYCVVCDVEASKCTNWSSHCNDRPKLKPTTEYDEVAVLETNPNHSNYHEQLVEFMRTQGYDIIDNELAMMMGREDLVRGRQRQESQKRPWQLRITEVLADKLDVAIKESEEQREGGNVASLFAQPPNEGKVRSSDPPISKLAMEGDISQLRLQNSFFVEGVKIGWPFSTILQPQRLMAVHIVKALKRSLHCVLESPTGTGKSAAILCSVLAWQRYHTQRILGNSGEEKSEVEEVPTIIYCSRTHSQVAQMVASLKKTPYRPRMCVLGSRDRMCIHKDLRGKKKGMNINQACRDMKVQTDKLRKLAWKDQRKGYDDDHPPSLERAEEREGDEPQEAEENNVDLTDEQRREGWISTRRRRKPICPHYQQLTTKRNATSVQQNFVLNPTQVSCCSVGGEHTTLGVHDVEDLVGFGLNPYRNRNIALYRPEAGCGSFGIILTNCQDGSGCQVHSLVADGVAAKDNRLKQWDRILSVNGIDARGWKVAEMTAHIKSMTKDPLLLDVVRGNAPMSDDEAVGTSCEEEQEPYSDHAVCPYYLSRALLKHANIVFAPYNYILDPAIRKTLKVNLNGAVVVLDEAHNVESVLCESGSGEFAEIDLCNLVHTLAQYSNQKKRHSTFSDEQNLVMTSNGAKRSVPEVAHELLIFLEKLVDHMRSKRERFEQSSPGLEKVKQEHKKFKLLDDHAVEVAYQGPSGYGYKGEAVGCAPMLQELGITSALCSRLSECAEALESHLFSGDSETQTEDVAGEAVLNDLISLISRFEVASKNPEHFYMACVMKPNGNMDYATSMDEGEYARLMESQKWRKHPRQLPFMHPRTERTPHANLDACNHEECRYTDDKGYAIIGREKIRHGSVCDGSRPRWECSIVLRLLSPGLLMKDLTENSCRSVILASGSLAPLPSLCAELHLTGPKKENSKSSQQHGVSNVIQQSQTSASSTPVKSQISASGASPGSVNVEKQNRSASSPEGRLQLTPKPLEANHVVDLPKQLFAVSIGNFPDGSPLTVSYTNYKHPSFFPKLGVSIATTIESVPRGGVLVFFPSYSFLKKCVKCWNPGRYDESPHSSPETWERLLQSKGKVIVEPTGSQADFEAARKEYKQKIEEDGNCVLLAVFRGKMSEGISFNDDFARCVICVGLPFPNYHDRGIQAKKMYNEEQRKIRNNQYLLPGDEWYSQQAFRAIAQALGRCIRHGADYGAVVLMDSRLCDDGAPIDGVCRAHRNLPKWMRHHIRTLSMRPNSGVGQNPVLGGFAGLERELQDFFKQAPFHSKSVIEKWKVDLQKAQARSQEFQGHSFDRDKGTWTTGKAEKNIKAGKNIKAEA